MNAHEFMDLCQTRNPDFKESWMRLYHDAEKERKVWIVMLQCRGISAAHPDDGWVNHEKNEVSFAYPHFNDGIKIGSLIALGSPDQYRIIKIIGHRFGIFWKFDYWKFEGVTDDAETDQPGIRKLQDSGIVRKI